MLNHLSSFGKSVYSMFCNFFCLLSSVKTSNTVSDRYQVSCFIVLENRVCPAAEHHFKGCIDFKQNVNIKAFMVKKKKQTIWNLQVCLVGVF
jgi:hypothetical protein